MDLNHETGLAGMSRNASAEERRIDFLVTETTDYFGLHCRTW